MNKLQKIENAQRMSRAMAYLPFVFMLGFSSRGCLERHDKETEKPVPVAVSEQAPVNNESLFEHAKRYENAMNERVYLFVEAPSEGYIPMQGPCDFNGDGWFSRDEMEHRIQIEEAKWKDFTPYELEKPFVPVDE